MAQRWRNRPDGSNWGDFGEDDQLGRVNLITRQKVLQGLAEAREGLTFVLSLPLDLPGGSLLNPRRQPPVLRPINGGGRLSYNSTHADPALTDVFCDDLAIIYLQYSTQWDSLAHLGGRFDVDGDGTDEHVYYNGFAAGTDVIGPAHVEDGGIGCTSTARAAKLGIENMAAHGIQGRGVLLDLHAHFGHERRLVDFAMIEHVLDVDEVMIEPGDILCLHTGLADLIIQMGGAPDPNILHNSCGVLDGDDPRLLEWITRSGLAAIAADNYAVESYSPPQTGRRISRSVLPLHEHCLFKNGIPLGELWHLSPLARWLRAHGRSRFLLTAPPLRLPGAVGSPVTPIATV